MLSGFIYPYEYRYRKALAQRLTDAAIIVGTVDAKHRVLPYLEEAVRNDPTDARLLATLISFYLELHQDKRAQIVYDQFKRVARASRLAHRHGFGAK